jgi:hypothetical protein
MLRRGHHEKRPPPFLPTAWVTPHLGKVDACSVATRVITTQSPPTCLMSVGIPCVAYHPVTLASGVVAVGTGRTQVGQVVEATTVQRWCDVVNTGGTVRAVCLPYLACPCITFQHQQSCTFPLWCVVSLVSGCHRCARTCPRAVVAARSSILCRGSRCLPLRACSSAVPCHPQVHTGTQRQRSLTTCISTCH